MFRTIVGIGLASAAAMAVTAPAFAQPWQSINDRQDRLEQRIDMGVRNGSLTRFEANRLRNQFNRIAWLESRYRRDGRLSLWERRDLDRRFDNLSRQIRFERHDGQDRWNRDSYYR